MNEGSSWRQDIGNYLFAFGELKIKELKRFLKSKNDDDILQFYSTQKRNLFQDGF
jgi:hypothetical protein